MSIAIVTFPTTNSAGYTFELDHRKTILKICDDLINELDESKENKFRSKVLCEQIMMPFCKDFFDKLDRVTKREEEETVLSEWIGKLRQIRNGEFCHYSICEKIYKIAATADIFCECKEQRYCSEVHRDKADHKCESRQKEPLNLWQKILALGKKLE